MHGVKYPIIYPLHRAKYPIIYPFCQDFFRRTLQKKCFDIYFGLSIMDNLLQILTFDANKILHRGRKSSTTCPDTSGKLHGGLAYSPCLCGSPWLLCVALCNILKQVIKRESEDCQRNQAAAMSAKMGLPKPKAVVVIKILEIHSLKPGPMAGKKIGWDSCQKVFYPHEIHQITQIEWIWKYSLIPDLIHC